MNVRASINQESINKDRMVKQSLALDRLVKSIDDWAGVSKHGLLPPAELCYDLMCTFVREYIQSFLGCQSLPDIRFVPIGGITSGHWIINPSRGFVRGQDIIYGRCKLMDVEDVEDLSYRDIIVLSAARILQDRSG